MAELVWEGKYDENGKRRGPLRVALPFQTVETVNESAQERQKALDMFSAGDSEWRNRLIWGDKKYVLPSLLPEFAGKVDLIYIDPPFNTGGDFSFTRQVPESGGSLDYAPNAIERKAYHDTWGKGPDSYLAWFYETVILLKDLLAPHGALYVHLDHHVVHHAKVILDECFGPQAFLNAITWKRTTAHGDAKQGSRRYDIVDDCLLVFVKNPGAYTWNTQYEAFSDEQIAQQYNKFENGRRYRLVTPTASKPGGDTSYEWKGVKPPTGRFWAYSRQKMQEFDDQGKLYYSSTGQPYIKYFLDERPGVALSTLWVDCMLSPTSLERVAYPTQKPQVLLERIIKTSSDSGDLVLDCFCGSGTTAAVAERLGRRWITCDLGRFAIHTARKRLIGLYGPAPKPGEELRPFVVQNLGKYERSEWQKAEFGENSDQKLTAYRKFILDLYRARDLGGHAWIHGVKGGRMVHVGSVDSPVSTGDVTQIAKELRQMVGTGADAPTKPAIDVLGWDFAFNINELASMQAQQAGIDMRFIVIPREVLEKKAVEQGDIHFYELAHVALETEVTKRTVKLSLTDFVMSLDDVPQDVRDAVTHWGQWIDYWAVDWNFKGDTFHNQWQAYRTKKEPKLKTSTEHAYEQPGEYTVMVKVIDILGNDTTKVVTVKVS